MKSTSASGSPTLACVSCDLVYVYIVLLTATDDYYYYYYYYYYYWRLLLLPTTTTTATTTTTTTTTTIRGLALADIVWFSYVSPSLQMGRLGDLSFVRIRDLLRHGS